MKGFLTSILALTFSGLQAQTLPPAPKLIIGITIDQLRTDYIEEFSSLYGETGFKRIWRNGLIYTNADFPFNNIDSSSAIASIYSGTYPCHHGIIGNQWMDISTLRPICSVDDSNFMGYYTDESSSPKQLLTSSITDELKISTQDKGLVYSISPFREIAILAAGHSANGAFWINDDTGKWCSSTYYTEFPTWLNIYNDKKAVSTYISNLTWVPMMAPEKYTFITPQFPTNNFKHKFDDYRQNKYRRFKTSPYVNEEVNSLTEECLSNTPIGQDGTPDFLSLTYYAGNFEHHTSQEYALEIQDSYVRLDKTLGNLLDMIDKKIGLHNVMIFISSTGYTDNDDKDLSKYKIPRGEFHLNRCAALLNVFLMATYGEGQYVESFYNQQIYLNHNLIEKKHLNLTDIQNKAAEFLVQFSGVDNVYTANDILRGAWTPDMERIRNSYSRKRSGDLLIDILPGWEIVEENQIPSVVRKAYLPTPLIFLGGFVKPSIITTPITIDRISPTIARVARIRAPNACSSLPIIFK
jgi:hypothetical protein